MKRTYVRITLALESAWRIGDWQPDDANTLATLRHPADPTKVWIPGSSIAGSLRRVGGGDPVALFGSEPPTESSSADLVMSPWWILGISLSGTATAQQRQRTAIDRHRRAAAGKGLFSADEVLTGEDSIATLYLRSDSLDESGLGAWVKKWQPRIGGGASIGMGRARVTSMHYRAFDLAEDDQVLELLMVEGAGAARLETLLAGASDAGVATESAEPWLTAQLSVANMAITRAGEDRTEGSAFKGLLRSRVEFIGRSLGYAVCRGAEGSAWTGDACDVCRTFGSVAQQGILEFGSATWTKDDEPTTVQRIAIDRFTGGTLDGALWPQSYYPDVSMTLHIHKHGHFPARWVEQALFHSLQDLTDHLCTLGPEGASGFGFATVEKVTVEGAVVTLADRCTPIPLPDTELQEAK